MLDASCTLAPGLNLPARHFEFLIPYYPLVFNGLSERIYNIKWYIKRSKTFSDFHKSLTRMRPSLLPFHFLEQSKLWLKQMFIYL